MRTKKLLSLITILLMACSSALAETKSITLTMSDFPEDFDIDSEYDEESRSGTVGGVKFECIDGSIYWDEDLLAVTWSEASDAIKISLRNGQVITKIVFDCVQLFDNYNADWTQDGNKLTWEGNATEVMWGAGLYINTITIYYEEYLPTVTLNPAGYATYSSIEKPYAVATEGVKMYGARIDGENINLTEIEGYMDKTGVASARAVLLYGQPGTEVHFRAPAVGESASTFYDSTAEDPDCFCSTSNMIDGGFTPGLISGYGYQLWALGSGNQFLRFTGSAWTDHRGAITTISSSSAKSLTLVFPDEEDATAINTLSALAQPQVVKTIENGRVVIIKNGQKFNTAGQLIK